MTILDARPATPAFAADRVGSDASGTGTGTRTGATAPAPQGEVFDSVAALIGNTPVVELRTLTAGLRSRVLVKLEGRNPGGSSKDRIALNMIRTAEAAGDLAPGATIVESTTGNTGIGLALVGRLTGHPVVIVHASDISDEKRKVLAAYGAAPGRGRLGGRAGRRGEPAGRRRPYRRRDAGRLASGPVRERGEPGRALSGHRPGDLAADGRAGHALRRIHRHRRHDQRHRTLPQGGQRGHGAGHRRQPDRLDLRRRAGRAHPGRRGRHGLAARILAAHLRPGRSSTRSARSRTRTCTAPSAASPPRRRCCSGRRRRSRSPSRSRSRSRPRPARSCVAIAPDGGINYLTKAFDPDWLEAAGLDVEERAVADAQADR